MPWSTTRAPGTAAKYRTPEHRAYRAALLAQLEHDGYLDCTADVCVFDRAPITNPDGRARDGLHAGHEGDGVTYRGAQHNACNVRDGARRGSARSHGGNPPANDWAL